MLLGVALDPISQMKTAHCSRKRPYDEAKIAKWTIGKLAPNATRVLAHRLNTIRRPFKPPIQVTWKVPIYPYLDSNRGPTTNK